MSGIVGKNLGRGSGVVAATPVGADAVSGSNVADDAIGSEHIADNAVGLAALAGGTDGQIISWDASGDPVALGPGSDGQVLTSTGAGSPPAFEAVSGSSAVYSSTKYLGTLSTPGVWTVTGVGFQPDVIWTIVSNNRGSAGISIGGADGVEEHALAAYNSVGIADTWDEQHASLFRLWSSSGNYIDATLTSMDSDGFTFTTTETGTYANTDGGFMFWCWKA